VTLIDDADPIATLDLLDRMRGDGNGQRTFAAQQREIGPDALARLRVAGPAVGSST
jgi:hypothetical protein